MAADGKRSQRERLSVAIVSGKQMNAQDATVRLEWIERIRTIDRRVGRGRTGRCPPPWVGRRPWRGVVLGRVNRTQVTSARCDVRFHPISDECIHPSISRCAPSAQPGPARSGPPRPGPTGQSSPATVLDSRRRRQRTHDRRSAFGWWAVDRVNGVKTWPFLDQVDRKRLDVWCFSQIPNM